MFLCDVQHIRTEAPPAISSIEGYHRGEVFLGNLPRSRIRGLAEKLPSSNLSCGVELLKVATTGIASGY